MKEFIFNDCDVCVNANTLARKSEHISLEVKTAYTGSRWVVGGTCNMSKGSFAGFGDPAFRRDPENFSTEEEAIASFVRRARRWLVRQANRDGINIDSEIDAVCSDAVQLSLF